MHYEMSIEMIVSEDTCERVLKENDVKFNFKKCKKVKIAVYKMTQFCHQKRCVISKSVYIDFDIHKFDNVRVLLCRAYAGLGSKIASVYHCIHAQ